MILRALGILVNSQKQQASRILTGGYELEASTTGNLREIVKRLPNYLINKWCENSYKIPEKGRSPKLIDLAEFVKRQAAIRNDPGHDVGEGSDLKKGNESKEERKQTFTYSTLLRFRAFKDKQGPPSSSNACIVCTGDHNVSECPVFIKKELQERWKFVKEDKLCHACLKKGQMRNNCWKKDNCFCGSSMKASRAIEMAGKLREICAKGGFNLTKFISNDEIVLAAIPANKRAVH